MDKTRTTFKTISKRIRLLCIFFVVVFLMFGISFADSANDSKCIKPVLSSEFGEIIKVKGKLKLNNSKEKSPQYDQYLEVLEVNGKPKEVSIPCREFDDSLKKALYDFSKRGLTVDIIGYESLKVDGLPDGAFEYYYISRQARGYSISNYFVVLKIEQK